MHESLKNTIDYIKMTSRHLAETKKFFSALLLGWSFQDYGPDYASFNDGRMTGGFFASGRTAGVNAGAPLVVFYHPELGKMLGEVKKLGGEVIRGIFTLPGGAEFAISSDK